MGSSARVARYCSDKYRNPTTRRINSCSCAGCVTPPFSILFHSAYAMLQFIYGNRVWQQRYSTIEPILFPNGAGKDRCLRCKTLFSATVTPRQAQSVWIGMSVCNPCGLRLIACRQGAWEYCEKDITLFTFNLLVGCGFVFVSHWLTFVLLVSRS